MGEKDQFGELSSFSRGLVSRFIPPKTPTANLRFKQSVEVESQNIYLSQTCIEIIWPQVEISSWNFISYSFPILVEVIFHLFCHHY